MYYIIRELCFFISPYDKSLFCKDMQIIPTKRTKPQNLLVYAIHS